MIENFPRYAHPFLSKGVFEINRLKQRSMIKIVSSDFPEQITLAYEALDLRDMYDRLI